MTKAEKILETLPSVKIGLDDHYGKQTVLNAINQALSMSGVVGRSEQLLALAQYMCQHQNNLDGKTAKDYLQDFLSQ
jgi:hypothetical protein